MKYNSPFYADLSTYSPKKSLAFYEAIFGWDYYNADEYYVAFNDNMEVSGLYETPDKFKQMRMPHFWMTYIKVKNINETINKAIELGGIIEVYSNHLAFGKIAIIRDVLGAGFTVYEGCTLINTRTKDTQNTLIWNELHISNAAKVIPFYQELFNWNIRAISKDSYEVFNTEGNHICDIHEFPNSYKGKYEYWACTFAVKDLNLSQSTVNQNGGETIYWDKERILVTDNSKEAFFYIKEV